MKYLYLFIMFDILELQNDLRKKGLYEMERNMEVGNQQIIDISVE